MIFVDDGETLGFVVQNNLWFMLLKNCPYGTNIHIVCSSQCADLLYQHTL